MVNFLCCSTYLAKLAGCDGFLLFETGCVVALAAESDGNSDIGYVPIGG